jgi:hypothetical protein
MVLKLMLKTQRNKAERVKAENQHFPYSTLIRRAMVEAYCPTLVKLVIAPSETEKKLNNVKTNFILSRVNQKIGMKIQSKEFIELLDC